MPLSYGCPLREIELTWTASLSVGVIGYNIYRGLITGGPYTRIFTGWPASPYFDADVAVGTTYFYVITATDGANESAQSAETSATA